MGMFLDSTEFEKTFRDLVLHAVPAEAGKALFRAANELLHDAIYKVPKAPFDKGDLRGSARTDKAQFSFDGISVKCGFNIVYAAKWHELTPEEDARINWSLPGSGRKYLETKMLMFKANYMMIVAEYLRKGILNPSQKGPSGAAPVKPKGIMAYYGEYGGVD